MPKNSGKEKNISLKKLEWTFQNERFQKNLKRKRESNAENLIDLDKM